MNVDSPRILDAVCYDLVLSDFPRGRNRALIQNLANGAPPYTQTEVEENGVEVNVSDLAHTRLCHDARSQFYNAFLTSGVFARASTDMGPQHKRSTYGAIVTKEWNRILKNSIGYFEALRAKFGLLVLHGTSPSVWENDARWCPKPLGVEDVLLPAETLLGFENLPFFVVRQTFTSIQLKKLTYSEKADHGWNMPFVKQIIQWLEEQETMLRAQNWPDVWQPEKVAERMKQEAGTTLAADRAPKIDVFDIYAWSDDENETGWVRRMILDAWSEPALAGSKSPDFYRKEGVPGSTSDFLFTSGTRKVAREWQNIISFQFADLSAVFPARYHSVRSLGWMLYASCHLGNRLRCKFYEAVFEALMQLYEVESQQDAQNALKLNLINKGFIDRTIRPLKAQDRWQVNANLVELGLRDNQQVISENAASWIQNKNYSQDNTEKTRFQVMAELQAMTALVSAALNQAHTYQSFEFKEIFRRFCQPNSKDPDVRRFRDRCLAQKVPEKLLNDPEAWNVETERVLGAGNKTMEMTIAQQLMEWRNLFDPEPQRDILRDAVLAWTSDPGRANRLVPEEQPKVTPAVREAQHTAGDLMQGIPMEPMEGVNHIETIETLLQILATKIAAALKQGGMLPPKELAGLAAISQYIRKHMELLAQDKNEKQRVMQYGDVLGKLDNQLKGFAQRFQQMMEKQAKAQGQGNGGGGMDPKDIAKVQAIQLMGKTKAEIAKQSAAQRTAQRKIQFEEKLKQQNQQHGTDLAHQRQQHRADLAGQAVQTMSDIQLSRMQSLQEPGEGE